LAGLAEAVTRLHQARDSVGHWLAPAAALGKRISFSEGRRAARTGKAAVARGVDARAPKVAAKTWRAPAGSTPTRRGAARRTCRLGHAGLPDVASAARRRRRDEAASWAFAETGGQQHLVARPPWQQGSQPSCHRRAV